MSKPAMHKTDVGMLNCGGCGRALVGPRTQARLALMPRHLWPSVVLATPWCVTPLEDFDPPAQKGYCKPCSEMP